MFADILFRENLNMDYFSQVNWDSAHQASREEFLFMRSWEFPTNQFDNGSFQGYWRRVKI
jgi:hypothetical protein